MQKKKKPLYIPRDLHKLASLKGEALKLSEQPHNKVNKYSRKQKHKNANYDLRAA